MQILSRNDETFKALCKPVIVEKDDIDVTVNSIAVNWKPAPIEEILSDWKKLKVGSYDLMIHPAEKKIDTVKKGEKEKLDFDYEFKDLKGRIVLLE